MEAIRLRGANTLLNFDAADYGVRRAWLVSAASTGSCGRGKACASAMACLT